MHAAGPIDGRGDLFLQHGPGRLVCQAALHHDHHLAFGLAILFHRKACNITGADVLDALHRPFDILGPDISAIVDNQILAAPCDHHTVVHHVAEVSSIEPTVFGGNRFGAVWVFEVSRHHTGAVDHDTADTAVGKRVVVLVAHFDLMIRH